MLDDFYKLLQPIKSGTVDIKTRLTMAPIGNCGLKDMDGSVNRRCINYFVDRARAGVKGFSYGELHYRDLFCM